MILCPFNAKAFGHVLTRPKALEWCERARGPHCHVRRCPWRKVEDVPKKSGTPEIKQGTLF
jgi:hypothetical protein